MVKLSNSNPTRGGRPSNSVTSTFTIDQSPVCPLLSERIRTNHVIGSGTIPVDTLTLDRVGWVVSKVVVVVSDEPRVLNEVVVMMVAGVVRSMGHRTLRWMYGPGGKGNDRRFGRLTSGSLVERSWVSVVPVTFDETPDSCPYEWDEDGGDPGLLTRVNHRIQGSF